MSEREPENFENQINQLARLLKKMMKNLPSLPASLDAVSFSKDSPINLNLFFFSMMPMTPEEMDEFEQAYENHISHQMREEESSSSAPLHPSDIEYFRRHGIQY